MKVWSQPESGEDFENAKFSCNGPQYGLKDRWSLQAGHYSIWCAAREGEEGDRSFLL
jgi:hypothetical protein